MTTTITISTDLPRNVAKAICDAVQVFADTLETEIIHYQGEGEDLIPDNVAEVAHHYCPSLFKPSRLDKVRACCAIIQKAWQSQGNYSTKPYVMATRLWNKIDTFSSPEPYWILMQDMLPWFFDAPSPNSARLQSRQSANQPPRQPDWKPDPCLVLADPKTRREIITKTRRIVANLHLINAMLCDQCDNPTQSETPGWLIAAINNLEKICQFLEN